MANATSFSSLVNFLFSNLCCLIFLEVVPFCLCDSKHGIIYVLFFGDGDPSPVQGNVASHLDPNTQFSKLLPPGPPQQLSIEMSINTLV